jgi:hypothetical protein
VSTATSGWDWASCASLHGLRTLCQPTECASHPWCDGWHNTDPTCGHTELRTMPCPLAVMNRQSVGTHPALLGVCARALVTAPRRQSSAGSVNARV